VRARVQNLDLDDAQQVHHTFGQLADHAWILNEELLKRGFSVELRTKMILSWWSTSISRALMPSPGDFLGKLIGGDE